MKNASHNPFEPGDYAVLDRPAKAKFSEAPDGRDEFTELFWMERPLRAWHEIAGVSRRVNRANLEKMIEAGLVETFGGEAPQSSAAAEDRQASKRLDGDEPADPRHLSLLGYEAAPIDLYLHQTNNGRWGTRLKLMGMEVYGDSHEKRGVAEFKAAAFARALAADLTRFAELLEADTKRRKDLM